jgi:hypothetical protein
VTALLGRSDDAPRLIMGFAADKEEFHFLRRVESECGE